MDRKIKIVIILICTVGIVAFFYMGYQGTRERPETLTPQERWIILYAKYDYEDKVTNITIKYVGENDVEARYHTVSYQAPPSTYASNLEDGDLGRFSTGDVKTLRGVLGYTHRLQIFFHKCYGNYESLKAEFDVLSIEDYMSQVSFTVEVECNTEWSGSIGGLSSSTTKSGHGSASYKITSPIVSACIQKQTSGGILTVRIMKNGKVVAQESTSAAYGVVTVSATKYIPFHSLQKTVISDILLYNQSLLISLSVHLSQKSWC